MIYPSKKFVNFTAEQLRTQLKDVIKPKNDSSNDLNLMLKTALDSFASPATPVEVETQAPVVMPGIHGLWRGPLDEVSFGVSLDCNTFQRYKESRFGFIPDGLPEPVEDWTLTDMKPF